MSGNNVQQIERVDYIKLICFCRAKGKINLAKVKHPVWGNVYSHLSDKELITKMNDKDIL